MRFDVYCLPFTDCEREFFKLVTLDDLIKRGDDMSPIDIKCIYVCISELRVQMLEQLC